jgi:hypothetical protein
VEVFEELQKIGQGPPEPVDRPSGDHVKLASGDCLHHFRKAGPLIASLSSRNAGDLENRDDPPTVALGDRLKLAALVAGSLLRRADAKIKGATALGFVPRGGHHRL